MRITNKSAYSKFLGQIEQIQNNKLKEETRLITGKKIVGIEDEPERLAEVKLLSSKISRNNGYHLNLEQSLAEMRTVMDNIEAMSDKVKEIRQLSIDAIQPGAVHTLSTYSSQIKGLLNDIINIANSDFNGKTLFSGTATTPLSLKIAPDDAVYSSNNLPFELIVVNPPTAENPSGMKVIFKGNNQDRIINKDANSPEIINVKSKEIFGENLELFNDIIGIYNRLMYNSDGTIRNDNDFITEQDSELIENFQKTLFDKDSQITGATSLFGAKYNRLDSLSRQIQNENVRLNEIKSYKSDTDVAKTTIALKMEETALMYSLQVGSRIMQNSLFDFLK
ncbi:MAG: hypothetical protein WC313_11385 [Candidatus Kapaibacterium sp.]|jgi:flagellar hook-associated protein 3 FlgL|nr:hypothetical protein [Candidatus Kapabacteria bacterium]